MNKPLLSEGRMYPLFRVVRRLAFVEAVVFFTAISSLDLLTSALVLYAFRRFFRHSLSCRYPQGWSALAKNLVSERCRQLANKLKYNFLQRRVHKRAESSIAISCILVSSDIPLLTWLCSKTEAASAKNACPPIATGSFMESQFIYRRKIKEIWLNEIVIGMRRWLFQHTESSSKFHAPQLQQFDSGARRAGGRVAVRLPRQASLL